MSNANDNDNGLPFCAAVAFRYATGGSTGGIGGIVGPALLISNMRDVALCEF